mgnify:CR=1 FL=1
MIFAAGLGTRLKPITDTLPKALVPIAGKTLLEHIILKLKGAGFNEILINVHHFPDQIIDFIHKNNAFGIRIEIADERNQLLDTGGGIKNAASFFDDGKPFLVHNVDILSNIDLKELYLYHKQTHSFATLAVSSRNTFRYLLFDRNSNLKAWINEKTNETKPSNFIPQADYTKYAFSGIQILSTEVFEWMQKFPQKFSIMDFYLQTMQEKKIIGFVPSNYKMIDVGKLNVLEDAAQFVRESK